MAGKLTLSVVLWTLFSVGVVDNAISGAGDDLLIVGVGHELCTEDVCTMTWTYRLLNLKKRSKHGWRGCWEEADWANQSKLLIFHLTLKNVQIKRRVSVLSLVGFSTICLFPENSGQTAKESPHLLIILVKFIYNKQTKQVCFGVKPSSDH